MAGASAMATSLTCALFPCRGPCSTPRSLPSTRKKRICTRKRGSTKVTAMLELEPPPYPLDALEPHMSKETLEYHWGQHHKGYVENLNTQIAGSEMENMSLRDILRVSYREGDPLPAFNNAAQVWNHDFFWSSMKPGGGGRPSGDLLQLIERDFGSFEGFVEKFKLAAATQFGSGWAWLAYKANRLCIEDTVYPRPREDDQKLVVVKSPNAINPLVWDYYPLLGIDVWEHAYYLDFENRRADYTSTFLEKLVSWERVSSRLETAIAEASEREVVDKARELTGKRRRRRKRRRTRRAAMRKAKKQAQQGVKT